MEEFIKTDIIEYSHCFYCDKFTKQNVLYADKEVGPEKFIRKKGESDEPEISYYLIEKNWSIQKCRGCEKNNFIYTYGNIDEKKYHQVFQFPIKSIREIPNWLLKLPTKYLEILSEVYKSVNERLFILSLSGMRTILDVYIVDKIGDVGSFSVKLKKLQSEGFITAGKKATIEAAIDAGNASVHRGYKPDQETIFQVLDIIENLLQSELIDNSVIKITVKTPTRK